MVEEQRPQYKVNVSSFLEAQEYVNTIVIDYQHAIADALSMPALKLPLYSEEEHKDGSISCLAPP